MKDAFYGGSPRFSWILRAIEISPVAGLLAHLIYTQGALRTKCVAKPYSGISLDTKFAGSMLNCDPKHIARLVRLMQTAGLLMDCTISKGVVTVSVVQVDGEETESKFKRGLCNFKKTGAAVTAS